MLETWLITLILAGVIAGLIYCFLTWNLHYWERRGIKQAKSFTLVGSFPSTFSHQRNIAYDIDDIYRAYKDAENFVGVLMMRTPKLLVIDSALVQQIFVKDFQNFHDNEISQTVDEKSDFILANNPFVLTGNKWKERRMEIIPAMTPNRIKAVYPITLEVCQRLIHYIKEQTKRSATEGLDASELFLRYTSEVVSECILGIRANSFNDESSPIYANTKKIFNQTYIFRVYQLLTGFIPAVRNFYKMRFFPKDVEEFFIDLMQRTLDLRRKQNVDRVDFINYMLQLQQKRNISTPEITSHVMSYMTDGFLTTATAITHCLLLLARHQDKQRQLRQEITEHLDEHRNLSFEVLSDLPYLDACLHEALRIFSPILFNKKLCTNSCELVNKNGSILKLQKNDVIMIPAHSLHHDECIYEEPELFKPERFLPENGGLKSYRDRGVLLAFGDGPRVCLGMRFALTQSKAAIAEVVRNFVIKPNPKTRSDNTLTKDSFFGSLEGGVWLDFESINA
ncbi:probable cytochrome P450 28d1 [Zeugodacus cucurbitae]|uniref:probable cytochrome P450 28d1 n=1 Tax=Zeugodacus cucurbitae TaxID=28588 RepID=UPI0023D94161|nr:probable cytochrome P450 28d1 [Zeugodacus cucurbitae]